jgi:hypothetical protein
MLEVTLTRPGTIYARDMRDEQAKSQKSQAKEGLFVAAGFGDRKLWRRKLVLTAAASLSMAPRHSIVSR